MTVAMLRADGIILPTPSDYMPDFEEISKAERNARGKMIKEVIAYKYKLNLTWKVLTRAEMTRLMNVKRKNSFRLEFVGLDGERVTGEFYAGTPTARALEYKNGLIDRWVDVKMNVIEM